MWTAWPDIQSQEKRWRAEPRSPTDTGLLFIAIVYILAFPSPLAHRLQNANLCGPSQGCAWVKPPFIPSSPRPGLWDCVAALRLWAAKLTPLSCDKYVYPLHFLN